MAFLYQNQRVSWVALYRTSGMSAGNVFTMSHAVITKARCMPTLLFDTYLIIKVVIHIEWM
jgi:hypothetical protein